MARQANLPPRQKLTQYPIDELVNTAPLGYGLINLNEPDADIPTETTRAIRTVFGNVNRAQGSEQVYQITQDS